MWFTFPLRPFTEPIMQLRGDSHLKGWDVGSLVLPIGDYRRGAVGQRCSGWLRSARCSGISGLQTFDVWANNGRNETSPIDRVDTFAVIRTRRL